MQPYLLTIIMCYRKNTGYYISFIYVLPSLVQYSAFWAHPVFQGFEYNEKTTVKTDTELETEKQRDETNVRRREIEYGRSLQ